MKFRLDRRAREEFFAAAAHYEDEQAGLGSAFAAEFISVIERILRFPESGPLVSAPIRRSLLRRFPYAVYYHVSDDAAYILAVLHTKRKPPDELT